MFASLNKADILSMNETSVTENGIVKDMRINAPSNKGLLLSVVFFFSPLIFVIYFIIAAIAEIDLTNNTPFYLLCAVTVFGIVGLWASGIVKSVSEIGRYYSSTAQVGLFIFLITPFMWSILGVVYFVSFFAAMLAKIAPIMFLG
jgi:hypothetical protein